MTSLISPAELQALVETGLGDTELQEVIDRVEAEITEEIGAPYADGETITETVEGGGRNIYLKRPIASVSSLTEYSQLSDTTGSALTENESFYVWPGEGRIERISTIPGAILWSRMVEVVYVPQDQNKKRKKAIIDLVRIDLSRTAYFSEGVAGEYNYTATDNMWEKERRRIMKRISFVIL